MPRESSLVPAIHGEPAQWATHDYLLANVVDGINSLIYAYVSAHSKSRPPEPKPVPRPQERRQPTRQSQSSTTEVAAFFRTLNNAGR